MGSRSVVGGLKMDWLPDWLFAPFQEIYCAVLSAVCYVIRTINLFLVESVKGLLDLIPDLPFELVAPQWLKYALASANYWVPVEEFFSLTVILIGIYVTVAPWRWVKRLFLG